MDEKEKKMNNWNPVKTECTGSISPASKTRVPSIFVIYETLIHKNLMCSSVPSRDKRTSESYVVCIVVIAVVVVIVVVVVVVVVIVVVVVFVVVIVVVVVVVVVAAVVVVVANVMVVHIVITILSEKMLF